MRLLLLMVPALALALTACQAENRAAKQAVVSIENQGKVAVAAAATQQAVNAAKGNESPVTHALDSTNIVVRAIRGTAIIEFVLGGLAFAAGLGLYIYTRISGATALQSLAEILACVGGSVALLGCVNAFDAPLLVYPAIGILVVGVGLGIYVLVTNWTNIVRDIEGKRTATPT